MTISESDAAMILNCGCVSFLESPRRFLSPSSPYNRPVYSPVYEYTADIYICVPCTLLYMNVRQVYICVCTLYSPVYECTTGIYICVPCTLPYMNVRQVYIYVCTLYSPIYECTTGIYICMCTVYSLVYECMTGIYICVPCTLPYMNVRQIYMCVPCTLLYMNAWQIGRYICTDIHTTKYRHVPQYKVLRPFPQWGFASLAN